MCYHEDIWEGVCPLWTRKEGFLQMRMSEKLKIFCKRCMTIEKNVSQIQKLMTTIITAGRILLLFYPRTGKRTTEGSEDMAVKHPR